MSQEVTPAVFTHICDLCGRRQAEGSTARPGDWGWLEVGSRNRCIKLDACFVCLPLAEKCAEKWRNGHPFAARADA